MSETMQEEQTGLPWPEIEYNNDVGPFDDGFWEWWEIPGVAKFNLEQDAIIAREAVNERPLILAKLDRLTTDKEKLRKALDSIANINGSQFVGTQDDLLRARDIARQALADTE